MRLLLTLLLLTLVVLPLKAQTTQSARPDPSIEHLLIISIDGLRPDVLLRAEMPNVRILMDNGAFTFWARSTALSLTLPTHVSMFTGVAPDVHGITWNTDPPDGKVVYPHATTLFQLAKRAGLTTALCTGKSKFSVLDVPESIDFKYIPAVPKSDDFDSADHAVQIIQEHKPVLMFVHFPGVDTVGHSAGWGTPEQLKAASDADQCVGKLLGALRDAKIFDSTMIVVTADHGGAGKTHGAGDVRSRTIPWIASGPGIRRGYDLSRLGKGHDIETCDTFATACAVLGIPIDPHTEGRFVREIFVEEELIHSK